MGPCVEFVGLSWNAERCVPAVRYGHKELSTLAGNAFSAFHFLAMVLALFSVLKNLLFVEPVAESSSEEVSASIGTRDSSHLADSCDDTMMSMSSP